jgi:hypothetical protein
MNPLISTKSASVIAASLPAMERNRQRLFAGIGAYMARFAPDEADQSRWSVAQTITDRLFEYGRGLAAAPAPRAGGPSNGTMDLPRRSMSCFGDGLGAVMKDVLGAEASPAVLAAWGDAYWAMARDEAGRNRLLAA